MISGRQLDFNTDNTTELFLERQYKLRSSIRHNRLRGVAESVNPLYKKYSQALGVYCLVTGYCNRILSESINNHEDRIIAVFVLWEFFEIYAQVLYRIGGDRQ